uniref:Serine/threonine protein phosphatase n=1 Tax=Euglena gracilis TaxID=3039 RepID=S5RWK7_EUGGR|nr:serine/threonine protein phosphatase [Euglena gracilis]|eukprot:EG_transcript_21135
MAASNGRLSFYQTMLLSFVVAVPVLVLLMRVDPHSIFLFARSPARMKKRDFAPPLVRKALSANPGGRVILMGDIHGCLDEMQLLLKKLNFQADRDLLVLLGDLVGKGPKPFEVIQHSKAIGAHTVLGNHDWTLLRWYEQQRSQGPDALVPFANPDSEHRKLARIIPKDLAEYLQQAPHIIEIPEHNAIAVHAGLDPSLSLDKQHTFDLMHMRTIVDGKPSEKHKGTPWASIWKGPQTVFFGHDAKRGLQEHPYAIGLDTGCVYGKQLTSYVLPEKALCRVHALASYAAQNSSD